MTDEQDVKGNTPLPIYLKEQIVECNVGSSVLLKPKVSNASGTLTWSLKGDLPKGLSVDPKTGILSGTVSGTPFQDIVEIDVSSDTGSQGSAEYTIIVNPALSGSVDDILPIPQFTGQSFSTTVKGSGGTGNYVYKLQTPIAGFTIGAVSGTLVGMFPHAGEYTIPVVVTDGIDETQIDVIYDIEATTSASIVNHANFTRRRTADIGIAKIETAISLRLLDPPDYINSFADFLDGTRKICADPTDEAIKVYTDMHIKYGSTLMEEHEFFEGMINYSVSDEQFIKTIYNAFRDCVYNKTPNKVNFNEVLRLTRSQKITQYLRNYNK